MIRFIAILAFLIPAIPSMLFAQEKVPFSQLAGFLQVCAQNSNISVDANFLGSVESAFTDGARVDGEIKFGSETEFLDKFPESDRLKAYEIYVACISKLIVVPDKQSQISDDIIFECAALTSPMPKVLHDDTQLANQFLNASTVAGDFLSNNSNDSTKLYIGKSGGVYVKTSDGKYKGRDIDQAVRERERQQFSPFEGLVRLSLFISLQQPPLGALPQELVDRNFSVRAAIGVDDQGDFSAYYILSALEIQQGTILGEYTSIIKVPLATCSLA
jgi:hypothetical protein